MTLEDPQPPITTVGLTVAHFVAGQQPFMADFNVANAAIGDKSV